MNTGKNVVGTDAGEDLTGTNSDDWIYGLGGRDRLFGKNGSDRLFGGDGDDFLDGGAGADTMFGGSGDDTYRVDDAGDAVSEESLVNFDDGGIDTVQSSITYTLGRFVEHLTLTGTEAIDGTGNEVANRITGNGAANTLTGGRGNDIIVGGAGNDWLIGGADRDKLTGGTGSDTFQFGRADATSADEVTDFTAEDWVGILASDYGLRVGSGLATDGTGKFTLTSTYFAAVSGSTHVQGTVSGHGQFVYNTTTRTLMWDADGAGSRSSGVALATFNSGVVLSAADFAIIGTPPPAPTVAVADGTPSPQTESGSATVSFTLALSDAATEDVLVTYRTANGTAVAGSDFVGFSNGQATIAAGSTTTTVDIKLLNDTVFEKAEAFTLELVSAQFASGTALTITDNSGTGNIADDDPLPTAAVANGTPNPQTEGAGGRIGFTVTLSAAAPENVVLTYSTVDGTAAAGSDFTGISGGQATIAAGSTSTIIWVDLLNDNVAEAPEALTLQLSSAKLATSGTALTITNTTATGNIADDDAVGSISVDDVTIAEGDSGTRTAIFTVSRTGTSAFTVDFATADGTATSGDDYVASAGTLTFAAGQATQTVAVTINGDTTPESNETFFLNLTNASNGGAMADGQGLGTITNDDAAQVVGNISINDVTIAEGNSGTKTATFTVSRTGAAAFTVEFATADGTAKSGSDYVATSGTLSFAAGEGTKTVSVTINGDTTVEGNETLFLNLTNAGNGGAIVDGQGLGTITNDDGAPKPSAPAVVAIHDMRAIGSTDPSALAYVPQSQTLFLSDSEVDESPFVRASNLWALETDGSRKQSFSLWSPTGFTKEPTGLAFDPVTGYLFISDDDKYKVFWVDPANPTVKRGEFLTKAVGGDDPEDLAINPNNGHLFIVNGLSRTIVETNSTGTQLFSKITLPKEITDPEALAYDARENVFYVGGGFGPNIWKVDRGGAILSTIDILTGYRNPLNDGRASVKDLELAPSSDPNDNQDHLSLYVADYGKSHVDDGRPFELNVGDPFWV